MVYLRSNSFSKMMMNYQGFFRSVQERPALHGLDGSYGSAVTFVLGYDAATSGLLLRGFKEWLVVQLGEGNNLAWSALAARLLRHDGKDLRHTAAAGNPSGRHLFELLDSFFVQRGSPDGMAKIFNRYLNWLKGQDWFRSEMLE